MPAVLETILDYVDYKSLARVQRVCTMWNGTVNTDPYWRRKLNDQVSFITQTVMCCVQFCYFLLNTLFSIVITAIKIYFSFQVSSNNVWEEISHQLPEDINYEGATCPDKERS